MALTGRQTLVAIVITFLSLLILFEFLPPATLTGSQIFVGIIGIVCGLSMLASSALMARGKLKPGSFWGSSVTEAFWQGIGFFALGLGNLSFLIVSSDLAPKLKIASALFLIGTIFVGRMSRKTTAEI